MRLHRFANIWLSSCCDGVVDEVVDEGASFHQYGFVLAVMRMLMKLHRFTNTALFCLL